MKVFHNSIVSLGCEYVRSVRRFAACYYRKQSALCFSLRQHFQARMVLSFVSGNLVTRDTYITKWSLDVVIWVLTKLLTRGLLMVWLKRSLAAWLSSHLCHLLFWWHWRYLCYYLLPSCCNFLYASFSTFLFNSFLVFSIYSVLYLSLPFLPSIFYIHHSLPFSAILASIFPIKDWFLYSTYPLDSSHMCLVFVVVNSDSVGVCPSASVCVYTYSEAGR